MLSDKELRFFDDGGYVVVPGLFQVEELAWLGGELRALSHGHATPPPPSRWSSDEAPAGTYIDLHRREEAFRRLAQHPRLKALASTIARAPVQLLRTRLCAGSRAGWGDPIWRRDTEVWRRTGLIDTAQTITAVVVLDGHYSESHALRVIPGSHREAAEASKESAILTASLGSVIFLHGATRYALSQPGDRSARLAFLITYEETAAAEPGTVSRTDRCDPSHIADSALWPVPIWIAG